MTAKNSQSHESDPKLPKLKKGLPRLFTVVAFTLGILGTLVFVSGESLYEKISKQPPQGLYPFVGKEGLGLYTAVIFADQYEKHCFRLFGTNSYRRWSVPSELADKGTVVYCGSAADPQGIVLMYEKIEDILNARRDEALQDLYKAIGALLIITLLGYSTGWLAWFLASGFV